VHDDLWRHRRADLVQAPQHVLASVQRRAILLDVDAVGAAFELEGRTHGREHLGRYHSAVHLGVNH